MGYTTESIEPAIVGKSLGEPSQFNLPEKEFIGYDPKGTQTITGSDRSENVNQTPVEAPVPEVTESITLSPKLTALARKEQAQRARERQLQEREKQLEEKLQKAQKYEELTNKLANKDYSAVDDLNIPYEEIVKHEVNKEAAKDPATERVRQLEERLEALQKAQEEKEVQEYRANQALWKQEILKTVKENEEFSTIKELGAEDIVLQHINDSFEEDGLELTVEQAAKDIEDALVERAEKFASITKINKKLSEKKALGAPKSSKPSTITQNMTTTSKTSPSSKPFHLMSESEQLQEAIRRVQAAKLQR